MVACLRVAHGTRIEQFVTEMVGGETIFTVTIPPNRIFTVVKLGQKGCVRGKDWCSSTEYNDTDNMYSEVNDTCKISRISPCTAEAFECMQDGIITPVFITIVSLRFQPSQRSIYSQI